MRSVRAAILYLAGACTAAPPVAIDDPTPLAAEITASGSMPEAACPAAPAKPLLGLTSGRSPQVSTPVVMASGAVFVPLAGFQGSQGENLAGRWWQPGEDAWSTVDPIPAPPEGKASFGHQTWYAQGEALWGLRVVRADRVGIEPRDVRIEVWRWERAGGSWVADGRLPLPSGAADPGVLDVLADETGGTSVLAQTTDLFLQDYGYEGEGIRFSLYTRPTGESPWSATHSETFQHEGYTADEPHKLLDLDGAGVQHFVSVVRTYQYQPDSLGWGSYSVWSSWRVRTVSEGAWAELDELPMAVSAWESPTTLTARYRTPEGWALLALWSGSLGANRSGLWSRVTPAAPRFEDPQTLHYGPDGDIAHLATALGPDGNGWVLALPERADGQEASTTALRFRVQDGQPAQAEPWILPSEVLEPARGFVDACGRAWALVQLRVPGETTWEPRHWTLVALDG